jgi:hypothetical protein
MKSGINIKVPQRNYSHAKLLFIGVSLSWLATSVTTRCSIAECAASIKSAKNRCLFKASSSRGVVGGVEQFSLLFCNSHLIDGEEGENKREKRGNMFMKTDC